MDAIASNFMTGKLKKFATFSHHMQLAATFAVIGAVSAKLEWIKQANPILQCLQKWTGAQRMEDANLRRSRPDRQWQANMRKP